MYKILVTGLPSGGKSGFARNMETEMKNYGKVLNQDVDYDKNWKIPENKEADFYILQTPHGSKARKEDGINPKDFDRIIYVEPAFEEYISRLFLRGLGWFKEGKAHMPEYSFKVPYCPFNIPVIFYNLTRWLVKRKEFVRNDVEYFENLGVNFTRANSDESKFKIIEEIRRVGEL